jgi:rhodanese-related sulfurtransferase
MLLAIALSLALSFACSIASSPTVPRAQLAEQLSAGDAPFVLDVRTESEYRSGHVPGATHIPFLSVGSRIDEIPIEKDQPIVVYCAHGTRAAWAARKLRKAGFTNVTYLEGHMTSWEEDGLPMEATERDGDAPEREEVEPAAP